MVACPRQHFQGVFLDSNPAAGRNKIAGTLGDDRFMIANTLILYIDPGTGSMLFSILIALSTTIFFGARSCLIKLKNIARNGKRSNGDKANLGIVIYTDSKRYWNVFGPIAEEFERRQKPLTYYTQSPDDPALGAGFKHVKAQFIGEGNKGIAKMNFLNADICLSTTPSLEVYQWKRSKTVKRYVHIPHTVDDLSGYRLFGIDFYDEVLTSGDNQNALIKTLEGIRPNINKKKLVTVGSTYLDAMQERAAASAQRQNQKKVVLVAPSWGKSGILSRYGDKLLTALAKSQKFEVIVRPHPQTVVSEKEILDPLLQKHKNVEWNFDNDNFAALSKADILITDFSGIIFDYSFIFDKPLIYADTNFDPAPYDAYYLKEPMWSLQALPKIGVKLEEKDFDRIDALIQETLSDNSLRQNRQKLKDEAWQNRGGAAKAVADYLLDIQNKEAQ